MTISGDLSPIVAERHRQRLREPMYGTLLALITRLIDNGGKRVWIRIRLTIGYGPKQDTAQLRYCLEFRV